MFLGLVPVLWTELLTEDYDQYQKKDIGCQFIFQTDLLLNLNHTFEQNAISFLPDLF